MAKASKKKKSKAGSSGGFSLFDDVDGDGGASDEEELPKDEAGRQKIKNQYIDLLGIRLAKLKGRILNRERIDKNVEGVYFICNICEKICHNLDDGLVEDEANKNNLCVACHEAAKAPSKARASRAKSPAKKAATTKTTKKTKKKTTSKAAAKKKS